MHPFQPTRLHAAFLKRLGRVHRASTEVSGALKIAHASEQGRAKHTADHEQRADPATHATLSSKARTESVWYLLEEGRYRPRTAITSPTPRERSEIGMTDISVATKRGRWGVRLRRTTRCGRPPFAPVASPVAPPVVPLVAAAPPNVPTMLPSTSSAPTTLTSLSRIPRPALVQPTRLRNEKRSPLRVAIVGWDASRNAVLAGELVRWAEQGPRAARSLGFGDGVKEVARTVFGWDPCERVDSNLTMQIGTKMREIDPDVWVHVALRTLRSEPSVHWVVDGVRFVNEYEALQREGFVFVYVDDPKGIRQDADAPASELDIARHVNTGAFEVILSHEDNTAKAQMYALLRKRFACT